MDRNDVRILPIVVDNRELNPASVQELADVKRFFRQPRVGTRSIILWPETSHADAHAMVDDYARVAGTPPIELPLVVVGPRRESWQQIALDTLERCNPVTDIELLGVSPRDHDPERFDTLGEFLRDVSEAFSSFTHDLIRQSQREVRLVVAFASQSPNAGVLSQLTNQANFGLLDSRALVAATRDSVIGGWWNDRPGALTQTIVRLDARAFCLPPTASVPSLRRHGDEGHRRVSTSVTAVRVRSRTH